MGSNYNWTGLSGIATSLHAVDKAVTGARNEALRAGNGTAETILRAYEYAGADDATASTAGRQMLKVAQDIEVTLGQLQRHLKEAKAIARRAADAIEAAEARRKVARAKLGN